MTRFQGIETKKTRVGLAGIWITEMTRFQGIETYSIFAALNFDKITEMTRFQGIETALMCHSSLPASTITEMTRFQGIETKLLPSSSSLFILQKWPDSRGLKHLIGRFLFAGACITEMTRFQGIETFPQRGFAQSTLQITEMTRFQGIETVGFKILFVFLVITEMTRFQGIETLPTGSIFIKEPPLQKWPDSRGLKHNQSAVNHINNSYYRNDPIPGDWNLIASNIQFSLILQKWPDSRGLKHI